MKGFAFKIKKAVTNRPKDYSGLPGLLHNMGVSQIINSNLQLHSFVWKESPRSISATFFFQTEESRARINGFKELIRETIEFHKNIHN